MDTRRSPNPLFPWVESSNSAKMSDKDSDTESEDVRLLQEELEVDEPEHQVKIKSSQKQPDYPYQKETWSYYAALFLITVTALIGVNSGGLFATSQSGQSPPWYPTPVSGSSSEWSLSYEKARALVDQMTFAEKVNVTTGVGWMMGLCVGNTGSVPRLNFPSLCLQDGPLGIRFTENITAFPAGITVAATWNKDIFFDRGRALGVEARAKGVNVLLGPAMGPIGRSPLGGRNWEGFGADPYLQGIAAAETIMGIQSQGVIATAKHWVGNEQEHFRIGPEWQAPESISVHIDDRTLHELYAWPFQDSVKAGVGSVMCSYNQINSSYACQNSKLLNGILKDEFGFQGFVQSDWLAQHSGVASALAGLDMDMPGDGYSFQDGSSFFGPELTRAALNGSVPIDRLNDMVMRIVSAWYQLGQDNTEAWGEGPNFSSWTNEEYGKAHFGSNEDTIVRVNKFVDAASKGVESHSSLARKIAAESIVLLKNKDNFLPLDKSGRSAQLTQPSSDNAKVGIFGFSAFDDPKGPNACQDRACVGWALGSGWGSGAVEFPYLISPHTALTEVFQDQPVELSTFMTNNPSSLNAEKVSSQDLCLVFIQATAGEGYLKAGDIDGVISGDRNHLHAQSGGDELAQHVATLCGGDVVVIIHSVGPVLVESFIENPKVKAVLSANLPGQESGRALTDILFGVLNPSGRLPYTIGKSLEQYGPAANILQRTSRGNPLPMQSYDEGLLIDYRYFDYYEISPRFEFGFGLSYTEFSLLNIVVETVKAKSPFPEKRPSQSHVTRPIPTMEKPDKSLYPDGFRALAKYIYSYLPNLQGTKFVEADPFIPSDLSQAGGSQGGNPSLFEIHFSINATISNKGTRSGSAVVQAYVNWPKNYHDPDTGKVVQFPVRTLRGFSKIHVEANQDAITSFSFTRRDLSYWSTYRQNWVMPTAPIKIEVGFSSRDIRADTVY